MNHRKKQSSVTDVSWVKLTAPLSQRNQRLKPHSYWNLYIPMWTSHLKPYLKEILSTLSPLSTITQSVRLCIPCERNQKLLKVRLGVVETVCSSMSLLQRFDQTYIDYPIILDCQRNGKMDCATGVVLRHKLCYLSKIIERGAYTDVASGNC